ncbi:protein FAM45A-like [Limulus polyphemus]|uniref:Protein FAM45A-like n=1 Tax=Limulus polyphemus TaxID=6850 RepID=A0ABM1B0X4_LIMPO|nr:protein FAM45A-like [Limulus polyphemus]XP_022239353.1 protein FAM45A-like [Limulus polyphemus]XP_022239354.1 protein FAM45A-like [Limulus polyphemus]XP_022239355.1 protein FAM45A-like [Limulus polyphemus]
MEISSDLVAVGLIERDTNNDILWTWSYPSIAYEKRNLLIQKCGLECEPGSGGPIPPVTFRYCHHHRAWYYIYTTEVFDADKLPKVRQFALVLQTLEFNPEKYVNLSRILSKIYCKMGDPTAILNLYLSVIIRGSCTTEENGTFLSREFDQKAAFAASPIRNVINTFGLESILIYTALILKKRIIVYHHELDALLSFMRALPALVWHRQNWNILYPYMELSESECAELISLKTYAAGFTDASVETRTDLYDVFVNLAATEITVASHAKEAFGMSKTHKDIAMFMVRQAENTELSNQDIIREISSKTMELLNNLKSLSSEEEDGHPVVTLESLKEHKLAASLENFLWNLAVAEGFVKV